MPTRSSLTPAQIEALEARFALRVSARLEDGAQGLSHDVGERLRVARQQAVAQARQAALQRLPERVAAVQPTLAPQQGLALAGAAGTGQVGGGAGGGMVPSARHHGSGRAPNGLDAPTSWGWRLASALPVLALVAGLWGIQAWYKHQQVRAAAEVDAELLTDDLPPSAYSDPGFEEYLRTGASPAPAAGEAPVDDAQASLDESPAEDAGEIAPTPESLSPEPLIEGALHPAGHAPRVELTAQAADFAPARLSLGVTERPLGFGAPNASPAAEAPDAVHHGVRS